MAHSIHYLEVSPEQQAFFEQFVAENPCSGFHQSMTWATVCELEGLAVLPLLMLEDERVIAGAVFLDIDDNYLYCPDGPVLDWSRTDALELMEMFFKEACRRMDRKSVMFKPRILSGKLDFSKRYIKYTGDLESKFTRMIDLEGSEEVLLAQMRGSGRRMLRIAQKEGVTVRSVSDEHAVEDFYNLYVETARRNDFRPKSEMFIRQFCQLIFQKRQGCLYLAYDAEMPVAGAIVTYFGGVATYFFAASNAQAHQSRAIYLLIWEAILGAKKEGMQVFDFGGITLSPQNTWSGFSELKEKFGGRIVDFEGKYFYQT